MRLFLLALASLLGFSSAQALEVNVAPAMRTYPSSASAEINARHEFLIWDQRDQALWKFGFIQPKVTLGAHGLAEGSLQIYPISILELGAGYGTTSRFYDTKTFNCDDVICRGIVQRHRLTARLVGAVGDFLAVATHHRIRISTGDDSKPLADESEVLLATSGGDTFEATSLLLGMKRDTEMFGVYAKQGRYLEARTENQAQYLIYRKQDGVWSYAGGLGRYASDFSEPGFSAYATVVWTWGSTISLF